MSEERKQNLNKLKSFAMGCTALVSALATSSCVISSLEPLPNGGWKVTTAGATLPQMTQAAGTVMSGTAMIRSAKNGNGYFVGGNIMNGANMVPVYGANSNYHEGYGYDPAVRCASDGTLKNLTRHADGSYTYQ